MGEHTSIYFMCAILFVLTPVSMATDVSKFEGNAEETSELVRLLATEVKDLQLLANKQGERIEELEMSLAETEDSGSLKGSTLKTDGLPITDNEESRAFPEQPDKTSTLSQGFRGVGVSFSVFLDHDLRDLSVGETIMNNRVLHNDGTHYDPQTGVFTAPVTGVYLFTYTIEDNRPGDRAAVRLVVDNIIKVSAIVESNGGQPVMGGNSAILRLKGGQRVWLQNYQQSGADLGASDTDRFVTFSGVLLY